MTSPDVCILLLTANRIDYAKRTLASALKNIIYPEGQLRLHIADDGSPEGYIPELLGVVEDKLPLSITNSQRGGYGVNYNLALQVVHSSAEIILVLEDDWELMTPLRLDHLVRALQEGETSLQFGCIRMGYIGWTQELRGKFVSAADQHFLLFDPDSPEPHVWAGHPRLETRAWQRYVGPWPEGNYDPGTTEFMVAQRPEARRGVVWPLDLVHPYGSLFVHTGTIQARTDQRQEIIV